jgi:hypothetical protein
VGGRRPGVTPENMQNIHINIHIHR